MVRAALLSLILGLSAWPALGCTADFSNAAGDDLRFDLDSGSNEVVMRPLGGTEERCRFGFLDSRDRVQILCLSGEIINAEFSQRRADGSPERVVLTPMHPDGEGMPVPSAIIQAEFSRDCPQDNVD